MLSAFRKFLLLFFVLLCAACLPVLAQPVPQTPNLKMNLPPTGYQNWAGVANQNFVILDTTINDIQRQNHGVWSNSLTYALGNMVSFNGTTYQSLIAINRNQQPDTNPTAWVPVGLTVVNSGKVVWPAPCVGVYQPSTNTCVPGGGGTPGGVNTDVQLNASGAFGADPNLKHNATMHAFNVALGAQGSTVAWYANTPHVNIRADCQNITGLPVVGDGVTDDSNAIQQCIWQRLGLCHLGTACTPTDRRIASPNVNVASIDFEFPNTKWTTSFGTGCSYFFSTYLDLPWGAFISGVGTGYAGNATQLCFASGSPGIVARNYYRIQHFILNGNTAFTPTVLSTFVVPASFGGTGPNADGIMAGGSGQIEDVAIRNFPRHGFDCNSLEPFPSGTPNTLQCDEVHLRDVIASSNRGGGFFIKGGDGGLNQCDRCEARFNQLYGFSNSALYSSVYNVPLGDGNHRDDTGYVGVIPAITATTCNATTCTFSSTANGLFAGDAIQVQSCSDPELNAFYTVSAVTADTFTVPYAYPLGSETPTGCTAKYARGIHIWAAIGNTVDGHGANGGCFYGANGTYNTPYCEGDQPAGTFTATGGDVQASIVISAQGTAPIGVSTFAGYAAGTRTTSVADFPNNSKSGVQLNNSNNYLRFFNTTPGLYSTPISGVYSQSFFERTFYGPALNSVGNMANWNCFSLVGGGSSGSISSALLTESGCVPDRQLWPLNVITVVNGGSNYTAPVIVARGSNGTGSGAVFHPTLSGGVITAVTCDPCGAGFNSTATLKVYDATGSGAVLTVTTSTNGGYSDPGRSAVVARGLWFMPQYLGLGTISGTFQPRSIWFMCAAPPTTDTWKVGDMCINQTGGSPFAWRVTTAGTPGTWSPIGQPLAGTFTTTTTTSEVVTLAGCTSASHPWIQPTNDLAAAQIGVFVSNPTTDGFTLNHSSSAGATYNVYCLVN